MQCAACQVGGYSHSPPSTKNQTDFAWSVAMIQGLARYYSCRTLHNNRASLIRSALLETISASLTSTDQLSCSTISLSTSDLPCGLRYLKSFAIAASAMEPSHWMIMSWSSSTLKSKSLTYLARVQRKWRLKLDISSSTLGTSDILRNFWQD